MMREEILERLKVGAAYLERTNLTEEQRKKGQARYDELEAMLLKMDAEEREKRESFEYPESIKPHVDKIREILYPSKEQSKKRADTKPQDGR